MVRGGVVMAVLAVSEAVPHFGATVELVGGLFAAPFIFIFPPAFYTIIKYKACGRVQPRDVVVAANLVVLGVVGCVGATVESLSQIAVLRTSTPSCFADFFAG
ncbi:hypothetical protein O3P69_012253 [Scylla paramamosain]|uniref:Amino acid transporter transmembrane domain-containing protein n=1 Tax=Scylla paramamosain TaxID=85552 RepID=A0AAW0TC94_SCYPA